MRRLSAARSTRYIAVVTAMLLFPVPNHAVHDKQTVKIPLGQDGRIERHIPGLPDQYAALHPGNGEGSSILNKILDTENQGVNGFEPLCEEPAERELEMIRLDVTGTRFRCTESDCEHHYDNCIVEVDYQLIADTRADLRFETSVSCSADITYGTGHGYVLKSHSDSPPKFHSLEAEIPDDFHLSMCFKFSRYEDVISAQLDAVKCRIKSVDLKQVLPSEIH